MIRGLVARRRVHFVLFAWGLSACLMSPAFAVSTPAQRAAIAAALAEPADAPLSLPKSAVPVDTVPQHPQSQIFPARGSLLGKTYRRPKVQPNDAEGLTLNFVNTDVKDVAKAVLGDYLKLNYQIAPNVQGTVTIQTSRPLPKSDVLEILDQTLRLNGMAVVFANNIYKVVSAEDAAPESLVVNPIATRHATAPGYGVEVAPIKYISAVEMQKLLEPLAPSKAIVHVDTARNVLIIEGTEQERQTLLEDIALFDSDWLAGMSFGLYTPTYLDSEELMKELTQVLGGANSPISNVVRLVPIDRLNAVLAISPQPRYLEQLRAWVARLDRPGQGTDKRIYVYSVQHGRASDLAATLAKTIFGGSGNSEPGGTPSSQSPYSPPPPPSQPVTNSMGSPAATPINMAAESGPVLDHAGGSGTSASGFVGVRVNADEVNNSLVILATPQQYARVQEALAQLDLQPLQVSLQASIAEVTLGNKLRYGVQFSAHSGSQSAILSDTGSAAIASAFPGYSYVLSTSNITVILDELSSITHVEVLSSPQVLVLNNQTATLQVGNQVPIISQQSVSTQDTNAPLVNTVQYQSTGVILKVTPRVNRSGEVMMDISQEVSDVIPTDTSNIDSPTIEERKIASSVVIQDGETIALGGLITRDKSDSRSGIPWLMQIPVLGELFRDTQKSDEKSELIVLITPHVVENVKRAREITEELKRKLPTVVPLLQDAQ